VIERYFAPSALLSPDPISYATLDLSAHSPEYIEAVILAAGGLRGVFEAPVQAAGCLREHRARLVGGVTHRDHVVPRLLHELVENFRGLPTDVYAASAMARTASG